mmetsp:Transcript_3756/g.7570  ORF Transcript_3756/g.7570 Transcript_3756/m.7570 type:complete len:128 (-) Transcript_3756:1071-1454(-)
MLITVVFLPFKDSIDPIAELTACSLSASKADVASSNKTIGACLSKTLATATLCFCPPLNLIPLSPTSVSTPSGNVFAKSVTLAASAACMISSSVASAFPYAIFSLMLQAKRTGSCWTTATFSLNDST